MSADDGPVAVDVDFPTELIVQCSAVDLKDLSLRPHAVASFEEKRSARRLGKGGVVGCTDQDFVA